MKINISELIKKSHQINKLNDSIGTSDKIMYLYSKFIALSLAKYIKKAVEKQRIGNKSMKILYKPLSPTYKKRKRPEHKEHFWIDTGYLINNIKVWKYRDWYVGIPPYKKYKNKKISITRIILYLEKGTKHTPPRPLFSPAVKWVKQNLPKLTDFFIQQLNKKL